MHAMGIPVRSSIDRPRSFLDIWIVIRILFEDLDTGPRLAITTTADRTSWHRAAGTAARIEAVGTACHSYDSGSYIMASRRRDGGAHGEQRGSRYCLPPPRQWVVHHGIAPPGRRCTRRTSRQLALPVIATTAGRTLWHRAAGTAARTESIEAVGTACHRYDSGSYIMASRNRNGGAHGEH